MRGLPYVLAIYGILFEEQVDLVIFWVVTLRNQMDGHKPGVCDTRSDCFRPRCSLTNSVLYMYLSLLR